MAELRVDWADGRREVREVRRAGSVIAVGDSLLPYQVVELGTRVILSGRQLAWLRVRVHGDEMPSLVLLTQARSADKLVLESRERR